MCMYVCVCMCVCVCVCVCSLSFAVRKTHAHCYTVICSLSDSTTFSTLSHKRHEFLKKKKYKKELLDVKCVFEFL